MSDEPSSKRQRVERWSKGRYTNAMLPNYVPPELLLHDGGKPLEALLLRAEFEDVKRLLDNGDADLFYQRQNEQQSEAQYDSAGNRTNTPDQMLQRHKLKLLEEIIAKSKEQHTMASGVLQHAKKAEKREIVHKIWLSQQQIETRAYGAIIGARGQTHQKLEKEYQCRIVVEGRGITDLKKQAALNAGSDALARAQEEPHVRITAKDEQNLKKAIERITWIIDPDDLEAQKFREENRKTLAIWNGHYDASTWVSSVQTAKPNDAAAGGGGEGGSGKNGAKTEDDHDMDKLLASL